MSDPALLTPAHNYQSYSRGDYTISTDPARVDVDAVYAYISRSYWATGRPRAIQEAALRHSLNFGVYHHTSHLDEQKPTQVGLARVITDYATFAYLCDVYILEEHQGNGLGKWLIDTLINDPLLHTVRRFMLATRDAHGLYAQFGFVPPANPELWMEHRRP
jgi:GNAT superfamily N-acetyltransferase